ncbi:MAG: hotdog fold thioesterase [Arenimonas sp.]|uniref:hotdog fold thioesterase n=1 Tax=Arenimonas sp. TaxID=1872635 RepID=UPI003BFB3CF3
MTLKQLPIETVNGWSRNTLMQTLGIECLEIGSDFLVARMPVDARTHQPMGLLHGGASMALIESIGSMGSSLLLNLEREQPVGVEINANHVRAVTQGHVRGTGKLVHGGKRTHLWQVDIHDEATGKLVCTGRLTVMVVPKSG